MKLIKNKLNDVILLGTNNNDSQIIIDGDFIIIGDIKIYGLSNYDIIEDNNIMLPNPFIVGYQTYVDGTFILNQNYLKWNNDIKECINMVYTEYLNKSNDMSYSESERSEFLQYSNSLIPYIHSEFIGPEFIFKEPPDEDFFWSPSCFYSI
jgi:hypothetical protein